MEQEAPSPMRSNLEFWKGIQEEDYFENHPCYDGLREFGGQGEVDVVRRFTAVSSETVSVIIGCGYGRESLSFARACKHVYGIDVSDTILTKAVSFLADRGVDNFTPVHANRYKDIIPQGVDLVFSIVVMQHLTRDLVTDYFSSLGRKLSPQGSMVVQFLEHTDGHGQSDAELKKYEPSVSWSIQQMVVLAGGAGLKLAEIYSYPATDACLWHWGHFKPLA